MDAMEQQRVDIFEKTKDFTRAREAQAMGFYPFFIPFEDSEGTVVRYEGREIIMIGSNNYLGLTTHPKVREAAKKAIDDFGTSCTGSRFMNGTLKMHRELEERLANFIGKESVLVFSTGYQTNLGTISAIVGRGDVIITDKEDHASIIDGAMLSLGELKRFRHNDMADLERVLSKLPPDVGKLVAVDGVYSMGGDIAPLPDLIALCKKYGARLLVDDAHSIGVLANGRGTSAHFGVTDEVDLITGTFSKSFASIGGFVGGDDDVMHYIQHHARSLIFSASLPAANTATVLAALDIIENEPGYVQQVWDNAEFMKKGLLELGFDIGDSQTPIIPIIVGDDMRCIFFWKALFEAGLFTNPVIPPAVPPNKALLRTSYMATHTRDQLERALNILDEVGHRLGII
ncbi:MAG: pyridoxal phosphate-dependent aminotransferase family protein [Aggregatilineales bacterium]|nr:pyridoxal phosphate-dependent aminotransferase family protein [Chloroflexota bacterium]HOA24206.1 pyridoxal phosphate-dependent aminotransferase family protein [Aggregatilineales bacterium]HQE17042.1 pyridoxal phosphate-dependent aminotransferase family protein [Aggregatilineales bacterium]